jgi:hypothetical protein
MRSARNCLVVLASLLVVLVPGAGAAIAAPRAIDLALRFQPHLFFDSADPWRPLDVDAFLAEPGHQACVSAADATHA